MEKEINDLIDCLMMNGFEQIEPGLWASEIGESVLSIQIDEDGYATCECGGEQLYLEPSIVLDVLADNIDSFYDTYTTKEENDETR